MADDRIPHSSSAVTTIEQVDFEELKAGGDINLPISKEYYLLIDSLVARINDLEQRVTEGGL